MNWNLHCPGGTPDPWDCLPYLLILNQHLIGTVCTLRTNQPLKSQTLIGPGGPGSQRLNKLLSRRKFIKSIEDPGIHQMITQQMCICRFLCPKRSCGKDFSSKATLDKHALTHQLPRYLCTKCGHGFRFQYELNNHSNTHTDFQIKCRYPRCGRVYKSESEYKRHYKLHTTGYQEYMCHFCGKKCSEKKFR